MLAQLHCGGGGAGGTALPDPRLAEAVGLRPPSEEQFAAYLLEARLPVLDDGAVRAASLEGSPGALALVEWHEWIGAVEQRSAGVAGVAAPLLPAVLALLPADSLLGRGVIGHGDAHAGELVPRDPSVPGTLELRDRGHGVWLPAALDLGAALGMCRPTMPYPSRRLRAATLQAYRAATPADVLAEHPAHDDTELLQLEAAAVARHLLATVVGVAAGTLDTRSAAWARLGTAQRAIDALRFAADDADLVSARRCRGGVGRAGRRPARAPGRDGAERGRDRVRGQLRCKDADRRHAEGAAKRGGAAAAGRGSRRGRGRLWQPVARRVERNPQNETPHSRRRGQDPLEGPLDVGGLLARQRTARQQHPQHLHHHRDVLGAVRTGLGLSRPPPGARAKEGGAPSSGGGLHQPRQRGDQEVLVEEMLHHLPHVGLLRPRSGWLRCGPGAGRTSPSPASAAAAEKGAKMANALTTMLR